MRQRTIASYVPPLALVAGTRAALERLGYRMLPAVSQGRWDDASWPSDVRLVDERHVSRVPRDATPLLVLVGDPSRHRKDERAFGVARRPADVGALYPLLQRALEDRPREAARAPVALTARCSHGDRRFSGEIVRLSQRGCLVGAEHELPTGAALNLLFPLPRGRMISLRGHVRSWVDGRAGLEFSSVPAPARDAIADYVQRRLAVC